MTFIRRKYLSLFLDLTPEQQSCGTAHHYWSQQAGLAIPAALPKESQHLLSAALLFLFPENDAGLGSLPSARARVRAHAFPKGGCKLRGQLILQLLLYRQTSAHRACAEPSADFHHSHIGIHYPSTKAIKMRTSSLTQCAG